MTDRVRHLEAVQADREPWRAPWPLLSVAAAVVSAAAGWVLVTGFCVLGWISVPQIKASAVLELGTQGWLLAHGVSIGLPGARLSIMPLGLTLIIIAVGLGACHQAVLHAKPPDEAQVGARAARMTGVFVVVYVVLIVVARHLTESDSAGESSLLGALLLICGLAGVGFARALRWRPARGAAWLRIVATALGAGLAVQLATGAGVVVVALLTGRERIMVLQDSLQPGGLGAVMLLLGQLAWLPNFVLWGGAWASGAGIQLGTDTVISPAQSLVGMLPAVPVLGAVPPAGELPVACLAWLAGGVAAGVVAGFVLVKQVQAQVNERLGIDVTAIIGALAGIGCGLLFTVLQLPAGGDLGSVRLIDLGARMGVLAIMAPSTMGIAGMATGGLLGWLASRKPSEADVPTVIVER